MSGLRGERESRGVCVCEREGGREGETVKRGTLCACVDRVQRGTVCVSVCVCVCVWREGLRVTWLEAPQFPRTFLQFHSEKTKTRVKAFCP